MPREIPHHGQRGRVLKVRLSGGGGHGNPLERDPAAVLADVVEQKLSIAHAGATYAVVIAGTPIAIDEVATEALRASRQFQP